MRINRPLFDSSQIPPHFIPVSLSSRAHCPRLSCCLCACPPAHTTRPPAQTSTRRAPDAQTAAQRPHMPRPSPSAYSRPERPIEPHSVHPCTRAHARDSAMCYRCPYKPVEASTIDFKPLPVSYHSPPVKARTELYRAIYSHLCVAVYSVAVCTV